MMKQEQFAGMRARLMEQLQQGVEWSDEAIDTSLPAFWPFRSLLLIRRH